MYGFRILEHYSPKKMIELEEEELEKAEKEEAWSELKKDLKKALKSQNQDAFVDSVISVVKAAVDRDEVNLDDE